MPFFFVNRKPRLLWANPFCLLDTSSGASMSVRQMLQQLDMKGIEIKILGATNFDHENGTKRFADNWEKIKKDKTQIINVKDGKLIHQLVKTKSIDRRKMSVMESDIFLSSYIKTLDVYKPDLVWFYGGGVLDRHIPYEARVRGIPSAAYLVNENYKSRDWCKDVDLIVTDTQSTSDFYKNSYGFEPKPVGKFIPEDEYLAKKHERTHVLFINPSLEKGAALVASLALAMEKSRPDIRFNVVQSRGDWEKIVKATSRTFGEERHRLDNVDVIQHTDDMRKVYESARILLVPSLWFESGARVIVEAMMNGIPVFATDRGGSPELMRGSGVLIKLDETLYKSPYSKLPKRDILQPLINKIEEFFDNKGLYLQKSLEARWNYEKYLSISSSTERLMALFIPLFERKAGEADFEEKMKEYHKQGI